MTYVKDPDEVLDYGFNWAGGPPGPWLEDGDTIATSTWVVPSGLTKESDTNDATTTTVWIGGGSSGSVYSVVNRIMTNGGRTVERALRIIVRSN